MIKKLLICLLLCLGCITTNAQIQSYRATSFALKVVNDYGRWTDWSDWERCNVNIYIDLNDDQIYIASNTPQYYQITGTMNYGNSWTDSSGGTNIGFYAYRKSDGHRCEIRLRVERNGNSQIYIEFNDAMWVYNVRRIN